MKEHFNKLSGCTCCLAVEMIFSSIGGLTHLRSFKVSLAHEDLTNQDNNLKMRLKFASMLLALLPLCHWIPDIDIGSRKGLTAELSMNPFDQDKERGCIS
jgi:hypothetical protein